MATFQDDIFTYVLRAKCVSACWADEFIKREKYGESVACCNLKLILLNKWISILEDYYCKNFGDGGSKTPSYACLSLDDAQRLLAQLKAFIK